MLFVKFFFDHGEPQSVELNVFFIFQVWSTSERMFEEERHDKKERRKKRRRRTLTLKQHIMSSGEEACECLFLGFIVHPFH